MINILSAALAIATASMQTYPPVNTVDAETVDANKAMSIPVISINQGAGPVVQPTTSRIQKDGSLLVKTVPTLKVPVYITDATKGVAPPTVPTLAFDQPLAIQNARTGQVTTFPGHVERKQPVVVPTTGSAPPLKQVKARRPATR
jgi:hypothetical protein